MEANIRRPSPPSSVHALPGRPPVGRPGTVSGLRGRLRSTTLAFAACGFLAASAAAQDPDTVTVTTPVAPDVEQEVQTPDSTPATSPAGALFRALLLPGWGHAAIGAYTRGGFYFAVESASAWMVVRNVRRLGTARDLETLREAVVRDQLAAEGVTEPDSVIAEIDRDTTVVAARGLVESREQQLQDWLALGIFAILISGVDAFVSAHLADFPEPLGLQVTPTPRGGVQVGVSVGVGGRRR